MKTPRILLCLALIILAIIGGGLATASARDGYRHHRSVMIVRPCPAPIYGYGYDYGYGYRYYHHPNRYYRPYPYGYTPVRPGMVFYGQQRHHRH